MSKERREANAKGHVAALERELEGYERNKNTDRAKEVKTEIARVKKEGITPRKQTATSDTKENTKAD